MLAAVRDEPLHLGGRETAKDARIKIAKKYYNQLVTSVQIAGSVVPL